MKKNSKQNNQSPLEKRKFAFLPWLNLVFTCLVLVASVQINGQKVYTVNSIGDQHDLDYNSNTQATHSISTPCNVGGGNCTLRAAIEHSRRDTVPVIIRFNIAGSISAHTPARIQVVNENYPAILDNVTIDGTSQLGFDTAINHPVIQLDGSNAVRSDGLPVDGIYISGSRNTVKGLHIHSFSGRRIKIQPTGGSLGNNVISGNILGTDPDPLGIVDAGNGLGGILIDGSFQANNNQVKENIISGNGGPGVRINENSFMFNTSARNNLISKNSIFKNEGLGIQFSIDFSVGVTPNRDHPPNMPVHGPNNYSNYPELSSASIKANKTHIEGKLRLSYRTAPFTIEFFANDSCHALGNGEGQMYLGNTEVQTDSNGEADINVDLDKVAPNGSFITATSTDIDKNTSEFSKCIQLSGNTQSNADLRVIKSADAGSVVVGSNFGFSIQVINNGPDAATGVIIRDFLPPGINFVQASPSSGTYNPVAGLWTLGALAPNTEAKLQITVTAVQTVPVINIANVQASDQEDPVAINNESRATVNILPKPDSIDLRLVKTASVSFITVGNNLSFDIQLNNDGPSQATRIHVRDQLPAHFSFVQAIASIGSYDPVSGVWNVGTLANAASARLTLVVRAIQTGNVTNTSSILTVDQPDRNPANNQGSATVIIQPIQLIADLSLMKTVSKPAVMVGEEVSFEITLLNIGPAMATNIIVSEKVPVGLNLLKAVPSQGVYNSAAGTWTIGSLPTGIKATLTIVVATSLPGIFTNKALIVSSTEPDPSLSNNQSSVTLTVQNVVTIPAQFAQLIMNVNNLVKAGKLSSLHGRFLVFLLQQANELYNRGDRRNAIVLLQAYKVLVNALIRLGQLSRENGMLLNDAAQRLIDAIQGSATGRSSVEQGKDLSPVPGKENITAPSLGNFPNPFTGSTTIVYSIPQSGWVLVEIFDVNGKLVDRPVNKLMTAGKHTINWNKDRFAGGVYLVRLHTADAVRTHRMVKVK